MGALCEPCEPSSLTNAMNCSPPLDPAGRKLPLLPRAGTAHLHPPAAVAEVVTVMLMSVDPAGKRVVGGSTEAIRKGVGGGLQF